MSLVDKFEGHIGDLVLFTNDKFVNLVGYVLKYTNSEVVLSNRGTVNFDETRGNCSFLGDKYWGEKIYRVDLRYFGSYEILKKCQFPKSE